MTSNSNSELGLVESFAQICSFLSDNPESLSWRGNGVKPSVETEEGLQILCNRYFLSYKRSDFPSSSGTIPDEIVSIVMREAYGYTAENLEQIKIQHQRSMNAENCVGALLERYLDSILRPHNWYWCCGSFVKAIDFIRKNDDDTWYALQIKNRDNSENSSSMAIREGTSIQKWFRSFSRNRRTNWDNLPPLMQGFSLSEIGFIDFVKKYLEQEKNKIQGG